MVIEMSAGLIRGLGTVVVFVAFVGLLLLTAATAEAARDVLVGRVQAYFDAAPTAINNSKTGKIRMIGVAAPQRNVYIPDVPTIAESGYPGFEATTWYGLVGPGKMPAAMAQRMNEDINKVLAMPDVKEKLDLYGAEDGGGSPQQFADFIRAEQQKWAKVIKDANVKLDS